MPCDIRRHCNLYIGSRVHWFCEWLRQAEEREPERPTMTKHESFSCATIAAAHVSHRSPSAALLF